MAIETRVNADDLDEFFCDNRCNGDCASHPSNQVRLSSAAPGPFSPDVSGRDLSMADLLNLTMLVCAAIGSMAFGVLSAYAIFRVGFSMMRPRRSVESVKIRTQLAPE